MQIDWFTVVAQTFNFLVLVALLRLVLYKPVVKAMADRAAAIESRWAEAEAAETKAEAEGAEHRAAVQKLDADRAALLAAARQEAEAEHQQLLAQAMAEVKQAQQEWRAALEREQAGFAAELRQQLATRICAVARRALLDLADTRLEAQVMTVFVGQLRVMADSVRHAMGDACRSSGLPVVVRTGFAVADEERRELGKVIAGLLDGTGAAGRTAGPGLAVDWRVDQRLACGIELETPGRQVRWSVDSYVDAVEQEMSESLRSGAAVER